MVQPTVLLFEFLKFSRTRRFVLTASVLTGLYVFAWSTKWTFDPFVVGTFWPGRFFTAQADAILHGHLWVEPLDIYGECFFHARKCYGYFGIFPSIIRIPFVLLLGANVPESTALFISIAAGISAWAALDLCRRIVVRAIPEYSTTSAVFMLVSAIALGPGSILVLLSDPYVYQEAIVWSIAGTLVGCNVLWRWWGERRQWQMVTAIIAFACAAGARPTVAGVGLVIAVGIIWLSRGTERINQKTLINLAMLSLAPLIASFGILFIKFDAFAQPFTYYQQSSSPTWKPIIAANDGVLVQPSFLPTALIANFRPDSLRVSTTYPWIGFRFSNDAEAAYDHITYVPSSNKGAMYVELNTSITNAMPLASISTFIVGYPLLRRKRRSAEVVILAALCTPMMLTAVNVSITARYLGDLYALVAVGMAFSGALLPQFENLARQRRNVVFAAVALISVFSLLAMPLLTRAYSWVYRFGMQ